MNLPLSWDQRYLRLTHQVALWSKDPSTQCGAVLVRPNRTLASVGFNGFPRGMSDAPELYADRPTKYGRVIHSEWNAIQSSHDPSLEGYTVYAWPMPPCDLCTAALAQKGIARVVCPRQRQKSWSVGKTSSSWPWARGSKRARSLCTSSLKPPRPSTGFQPIRPNGMAAS